MLLVVWRIPSRPSLPAPDAALDRLAATGYRRRRPRPLPRANALGAEVLFGPQSADPFLDPSSGSVAAAINAGAERFDFVLVDIGTKPTNAAWEGISACDFLVLVADREPTSIQAAKRWLQWFQLKGLGADSIGTVVVNRSGLPTNVSMQQVAREIGCPLVGVIPSAGEHMAHASTRQEILLQWKPDNLSAVSLMDTAVRLSAKRVEPIGH